MSDQRRHPGGCANRASISILLLMTLVCASAGAVSAADDDEPGRGSIRVATYNVSLSSDQPGELVSRLRNGDPQARAISAVIQRVRPDLLLLNEFDYDAAGVAAQLLVDDYLGKPQHGERAIDYPHRYLAPVNTGVPSGLDLNSDGVVGGPQDAWGFGSHPGQYGMLVLSRYPLDKAAARTFQKLLWSALPDPQVPSDPATGGAWYPSPVWSSLRLSSKSHWDVPVATPLGTLHFLVAHPTPPVFDGPEDRNGARNHDEIALWARYLGFANAEWLCDDAGVCGGLPISSNFVIAGDYNADPVDGDSRKHAIRQLLDHPRVLRYTAPASAGAAQAPVVIDKRQRRQVGRPANDTGQFGRTTGNLRVDYVLPSNNLIATDSGVFWPAPGEPGAEWITASDHRLVWVDVALPDSR